MFKSKRIQSFPPSDRFQFLRLMQSIKDLAVKRNDDRLALSAKECLNRLIEGYDQCPLSQMFREDYINTELPPSLAFVRSEGIENIYKASPCELLQRLMFQVKLQAANHDDSKYLESIQACEGLINNGDDGCPFHWIKAENAATADTKLGLKE
jgi:hypothetical protein